MLHFPWQKQKFIEKNKFFFGKLFLIPENNLILVEPANSTRVFICISQAMLHEVSRERERERDPENLQLVAARNGHSREMAFFPH